MYVVLGFSLFFHREDNPASSNLFELLDQSLRNAILISSDSRQAGWPKEEWRLNPHTVVRSDEWVEDKPSNGFEKKLLRVQLEKSLEDYSWTIDLRLGQIREEDVVFFGKWQISPYKVVVPVKDIPRLDAFRTYSSKNQDGLFAGKTYVVSKERVKSFVEFLESSQRRLPVVLVSRRRNSSRYLLPDIGGLAIEARGLAHVFKLKDDKAAQALRALFPNHGCYDGAVRIFWPGFSPEDDPIKYPFWPPSQLWTVDEEVHASILEQILEQFPRILTGNTDIEDLERQWAAERDSRKVDVLRRQLDALESERIEWDEFFKIYDQVEQERNDLRDENSSLKHKVRSLEWHFNNASIGGIPQEEQVDIDQSTDAHKVYLSSKARKKYGSFAIDERDYWDEHLFGKLINEQMRSNQSEPLVTKNGTCWVYPRSRTADGRRLVYYIIEQQIRVCEIFDQDEHDKEYTRLRNEGVCREDYEEFEPLRTDAA